MSADVWIESAPCDKCGRDFDSDRHDLNITYNLSRMLGDAGFIGWRHIIGLPANVVGGHILGVLEGMAANPKRWRNMNPPNGWGDYDKCIQGRMRAWANQCLTAPDGAIIGGSL